MQVFKLQAGLLFVLFVPAGTWDYWQAGLFWVSTGLAQLAILGYFLRHDPALIRRRLTVGPGDEPRPQQRRILRITAVLTLALLVLPGLQRRAGTPLLAPWICAAGFAAVIAGFAIIFLTFRANTFAAGIVQVEPGQQVISRGPYARVRHPMYSGAAIGVIGTALALGSLAALVLTPLLIATLVARIIDEERTLRAALPGYGRYCASVRWRLLPGVW